MLTNATGLTNTANTVEPAAGEADAPVAAAPATPAPKTARRTFPRYAYASPSTPAPGTRADAEPHFASGLKAHRAGEVEAAVEHYRQAVRLDPGYFEAQYNLGLAEYDLRNWKQSLSAYEAALALKPDSADARYNFALALKQARYVLDAVEEMRRVVNEHPDEARAHYSLGNMYAYQLQEPAQAREHFLKVLELEPRHPQAMEIRYWLAAQSRADRAAQ
jgi:tetratricopeptide (TPR) repeat protein